MFERFTDASRAVVLQAEHLAAEAGAGLIGEEHLLLALLGRLQPSEPGWPMVSSLPVLQELAPGMRSPLPLSEGQKRLPFTPSAKKCLELALKEALIQGHNYIGRAHLLLGVLRVVADDPTTVVAQLLARVDVDPGVARQDVLNALGEIDRKQAAREKQRDETTEAQRRDPRLCVFCGIIDGQEEASRVYEDERVVAFLDVRPINSGHVLVVPREHLPYLADVGEDLGAHMYRVGHRVAAALRGSDLRCAGVGMMIADGAAAGQEIFHSHLHVYPRNPGDGYRINAMWRLRERPELDQTAARIRQALQPG